MTCGSCSSSPGITCSTVYPVLSPCACDDAAPIRVEGPDGQDGPKGTTPHFSIGTVTAGAAAVSVVFTDEFNRVINWVLPAIPEGVPYTWTEVNTFEHQSIFELGLITTGGTSTFGGSHFYVNPDAAFGGDLAIAEDESVGGDYSIGANETIAGYLIANMAGFTTTLDIVEFTFGLDLRYSTLVVTDASGFVGGLVVLNDCLQPNRLANIGSGLYTKAQATGLVNIGPVDVGPICDNIVVNVPASTCPPQVNPLVDIRIRVGYKYADVTAVGANFSCTVWQTMVGGTVIDFYTQSTTGLNSQGGFFELRGQATLALGNNDFIVEVTNQDPALSFEPSSVTYWITN